jgi:hypothetical protein
MTAWVYERIAELRIHRAPDMDKIRILQFVLLAPAAGEP